MTALDDVTPLDMARNAARAVLRYAGLQERDPTRAYVLGAGQQGHQAAQLAQAMALVSIAEDVHRIAELLIAGPAPDPEEPTP